MAELESRLVAAERAREEAERSHADTQRLLDIARWRLESYVNFHRAAESLLDLIHKLGEAPAPGENRPLLQIDCADDVTAEAVKEQLNTLWELVKNSEPAPDKSGFVQIPSGMLRAAQRRAETAEALATKAEAERDTAIRERDEARRLLSDDENSWRRGWAEAVRQRDAANKRADKLEAERDRLAAQLARVREIAHDWAGSASATAAREATEILAALDGDASERKEE